MTATDISAIRQSYWLSEPGSDGHDPDAPDIFPGMDDDDLHSAVHALAGHRLDDGIAVAHASKGVAYLEADLYDDAGRIAVVFEVPVAKLYEARGNQFAYADIGVDWERIEHHAGQMLNSIAAYEDSASVPAEPNRADSQSESASIEGHRSAMDFDAVGLAKTRPAACMPPGLSASDFPGPERVLATDGMDHAGRTAAVADLIKSLMRHYEADVVFIEPALRSRLDDLEPDVFEDFEQRLGEHGIIASCPQSGPYARHTMALRSDTDASRPLVAEVLTIARIQADGMLTDGRFGPQASGIRPLRTVVSIGNFFKLLADFYRERSPEQQYRNAGGDVVLVVEPELFDAVAKSFDGSFRYDDDWPKFAAELARYDLVAHTHDAHGTVERGSTSFMVADAGFYNQGGGAHDDNAAAIKVVHLNPAKLEADGFWDDGCFSAVNDDGVRLKLG